MGKNKSKTNLRMRLAQDKALNHRKDFTPDEHNASTPLHNVKKVKLNPNRRNGITWAPEDKSHPLLHEGDEYYANKYKESRRIKRIFLRGRISYDEEI